MGIDGEILFKDVDVVSVVVCSSFMFGHVWGSSLLDVWRYR